MNPTIFCILLGILMCVLFLFSNVRALSKELEQQFSDNEGNEIPFGGEYDDFCRKGIDQDKMSVGSKYKPSRIYLGQLDKNIKWFVLFCHYYQINEPDVIAREEAWVRGPDRELYLLSYMGSGQYKLPEDAD